MCLAVPASAAAAPKAETYHGSWNGGMYGGCTTNFWGSPMMKFDTRGTWDVSFDANGAPQVAATIEANFNDGYGWFPVDSFSGNDLGTWQVVSHGGPQFHLRIEHDNMAGSQVDFTLTGNALRFRIQPYPFPPFMSCQFAESYGTLTSAE
jgi:hypothetical protein